MNSLQQPVSPSESQQSRLIRWIVGVGLPLVAGTTLWWLPALWGHGDIFDEATPVYVALAVTIALAFAGAAVLRSWWALLIVPAAWLVGELLMNLVTFGISPANPGWGWGNFFQWTGLVIMFVALPLVISSALGVLVGQWLARRSAKASQTPLGV